MLAIALLVGSTLAWMVLEAAVSSREPHTRLPRELATGLTLLAVHAAAIVEHLVRQPATSPALFAIGTMLIGAGITLRVSAIRTLGPAFISTTTSPLRVVRSGPYRWLRHPSEVGLVAAAAGAAALLSSMVAAALFALVLAPLAIARCAAENRTLSRC
jgi:protein-S-isoprenylcysteine O-methyltransferase Ste14